MSNSLRNLPYWFGSHGQLKTRIAQVVRERAQKHGLVCDLSTRQRQLERDMAAIDPHGQG